MKRYILWALLAVVLIATPVFARGPYQNFGETDTNSALNRAFDPTAGHDHDGTNSKLVSAALSGTLTFEGTTADANELTLSVTDPTGDTTVTLADASGTVMLSSLATNAPNVANSVTGGTNQLIFEGSGADASEAVIDAANVTADVVYRLPDAAAATYALMSSTLNTNAPDIANSVYGVSNGLTFEGATANGFETNVTPTDPTADQTITLPNASGTVPVQQSGFVLSKMWVVGDTIASGQTTKAVTVTGITTAAKCFATALETPTNACYIKQAIPTANTLTVGVNTDPGASNLDIAVLCFE